MKFFLPAESVRSRVSVKIVNQKSEVDYCTSAFLTIHTGKFSLVLLEKRNLILYYYI